MLQGSYFVISPDSQPLLHCWSLSVEEQFYLVFPAIFLFIYRKANNSRLYVLGALCGISLVACIILTRAQPIWAFFLLPTRAWELLVGSILATMHKDRITNKALVASAPIIGLALLAVSFLFINENSGFPGFLAIVPVVGTACFLIPSDASNTTTERVLSWRPLVLIGTMSYSLYLWHWPVFSFVDYRLYTAMPLVRLVLKILVSAAATTLCFFLVEKPSRGFLNQPGRRRLAFACAAGAILTLVPLGFAARTLNYINAAPSDVPSGGLVFNQSATKGSMVLMGDSNASMYGKMAKELAKELDFKLNVISVASGDPLPHSFGQSSELWRNALAFVRREKPDVLVLVCNWSIQLLEDRTRLSLAIKELKPSARHLILLTQPPERPDLASREGFRNGSRPPFQEDPVERDARLNFNSMVKSFDGDNVTVIDIEPLFSGPGGTIRFADNQGRELYQDYGHLSAVGADLVKSDLSNAIVKQKSNR